MLKTKILLNLIMIFSVKSLVCAQDISPVVIDRLWNTDFSKAQSIAASSNKKILLVFSGSDWCAPCIRLKKEILNNPDFITYAQENLVLLLADFPRMKENQLNGEQFSRNQKLAERYNPGSSFPLVVLLKPDGSVLMNWEGFPGGNAKQFITDIADRIK